MNVSCGIVASKGLLEKTGKDLRAAHGIEIWVGSGDAAEFEPIVTTSDYANQCRIELDSRSVPRPLGQNSSPSPFFFL